MPSAACCGRGHDLLDLRRGAVRCAGSGRLTLARFCQQVPAEARDGAIEHARALPHEEVAGAGDLERSDDLGERHLHPRGKSRGITWSSGP